MKKIFAVLILAILIIVSVSSCTTSRRSGCPMEEGIIH